MSVDERNPPETPRCRLCGCKWWVRVSKLEYQDRGPDGKFAIVHEAQQETANLRYQCAKCGALLDVDYESGSVTYHLETRHGNLDFDGLVRAIEQRMMRPKPWPSKG